MNDLRDEEELYPYKDFLRIEHWILFGKGLIWTIVIFVILMIPLGLIVGKHSMKARQLSCRSDLRRVYQATLLYAETNAGRLPDDLSYDSPYSEFLFQETKYDASDWFKERLEVQFNEDVMDRRVVKIESATWLFRKEILPSLGCGITVGGDYEVVRKSKDGQIRRTLIKSKQ